MVEYPSLDRLVFGTLQGVAVLFIAPGVAGLISYFKAELQQRRRRFFITLRQPYLDLAKLMGKSAMRAETTSTLFAVVPVVLFVSYGILAFVVPVFHRTAALAADLILIVYILGLARFVLSLAGLDAGAPFGGLGGSREMLLHFLTEIGLFTAMAVLAIRWQTVNLQALLALHGKLGIAGLLRHPELVLVALSFIVSILFESGRIPIDDPTTHLELSMGQKAITLEYAGRDLALVEWAEMIKFTFLLTLFAGLFLPTAMAPDSFDFFGSIAALAWYAGKMVCLIFALAIWELRIPKLRTRSVVRPGLYPIVFSTLAIVYYTVTTAFGGRP